MDLPSTDIVAYAIPVFFALIGVEAWLGRRDARRLYRLNDSITNLSCGILNQVVAVFFAVLTVAAYCWTYETLRLFELKPSWWVFALCMVGVDLGYYWFHRSSHMHNFLWASHVVHHQSEDFNYTVALRQGAFEPLASWVFYQPLALLGFPPLLFLTCNALNTLYQFLPHTRTVGKLPGWFEWVFNSPSHHRVHHGCDPKYLDRNYAGMFIVWDRLFGTYQEEEEEPTYGTVDPLASWNPLWANVWQPLKVWRHTQRFDTWGERLRIWWLGPTALVVATEGGGKPIDVTTRPPYDAGGSSGLGLYLVAQFVGLLLGAVGLLFGAEVLDLPRQVSLASWVVVSALSLGALWEARRWAMQVELIRLVALPIFGGALAGALGGVLGLALAAGSAAWLLRR